jgi:hypothetical protein
MNSSSLENKKVEPKKVNSDFFDSDQESDNSRINDNSRLENQSTEDFSQIMRKLRLKHNLKFKSTNTSLQSSKQSERKFKDESVKKDSTKPKMGMSGLFNTLFKELSVGEKMCDDTYDKVNQQSEVFVLTCDFN